MTHEPTVIDALDSRPAYSGCEHPSDDDPRPRPRPAWLTSANALARQFRETSPPDADTGNAVIEVSP
jgi:hypothetical protein